MSSAARHVPPPLNLPFKYRRKSYSSEFEERPSSGTSSAASSATSFSLPSNASARPHSWLYASTSASSSPVASSPPSSTYDSSPPRAHAFPDPVNLKIHRNNSPHYHHALPVSADHDHDIAWRNDLLDVDKPYSSSSLTALYTTRYGRYAYGYAVPRAAPYAISSDSEEPPLASDLDATSRSAYSDDMDVDADSESSRDVDVWDDLDLDVFSPLRRRISFSTSAERDKPYVRPITPSSPSSSRKRPNRPKPSTIRAQTSSAVSTSSASPPGASSSSSSPAPVAQAQLASVASSQLPTPPVSSPEEGTPPLVQHVFAPPALAQTPPPERRTRSRPTLMDLLSPSPSKPIVTRLTQDRESSPCLLRAAQGPFGRSSPLPSSSPIKASSPLPDSSPVRRSSPLPDSSPIKQSSPLPSSPLVYGRGNVSLPSEPEEPSSLPTPTSPHLSPLSLPPSTSPSLASSSPETDAAQVPVFTPSPSQMPLTPPSPALVPSSPSSIAQDLSDADGKVNTCRSFASTSPVVAMKEISPLRLDEDGDEEMQGGGMEEEDVKPAVVVDVIGEDGDEDEGAADVDDDVDADADGMNTVTATPSRAHSRTPLPPRTASTPPIASRESMAVEHDDQAVRVGSASVGALRPGASRGGSMLPASRAASVLCTSRSGSALPASRASTVLPITSPRTTSPCLPAVDWASARCPPSTARLSPPLASTPAQLRSLSPAARNSRPVSPRPASTPALSSSLSPPPASTPSSRAIKHEELLLSSPLSSLASPSSHSGNGDEVRDAHDESASSDEEDTARCRPPSKKRSGSRFRDGEGVRKKRLRVETEDEGEGTVDEVPVKAKAKRESNSRGRKSKARSAAPEGHEEEDVKPVEDRLGSARRAHSKPARSATPHAQRKKRGRRKRERSLTSSPETHSRARRRVDWAEEAPLPLGEIEGMIIETLATARATSLSAAAIYGALMASRPALRTAPRRVPASLLKSGTPDEDGDEPVEAAPLHKHDWLHLITTILSAGHLSSGVFGKVDSSASDSDSPSSPSASPMHVSHKAALLAQWFYVPEKDLDRERAGVIRTMMRGPGKRSETMKYKQYYWKPLGKISRWDPEDDL